MLDPLSARLSMIERWFAQQGSPGGKALAVTSALIVAFQIEVLIRDQVGADTIAGLIADTAGISRLAVLAVSPLIHQAAALLVGNLVSWVVLGYLFGRHTTRARFYAAVIIVGYLTNHLAPLVALAAGYPAAQTVGFSGVTHALAVHETLYLVALLRRRGRPAPLPMAALCGCLVLLFPKIAGIPMTPPGVSLPAHLGGLVLGLAGAAYTLGWTDAVANDPWSKQPLHDHGL